nr:cell division protein FtsZ [uncultured Bacteroides sp.]
MTDDIMPFEFPTDTPSIIKVIGVGGGGGNAVNHMYKEGIHDVTFVLCNTDNQALAESPVPVKLQLGRSITEGLGAGNKPERASAAAEESIEDIKTLLSDGTKMVFITAGMGGGTGTGAAPVIAKTAKEMDILTIGIVTIPFLFEGEKKIIQALDGVEQISRHVDALLVINNERLREIYADLTFMNAFGKADDTLSIAAKSIAEIITMRGKVNLDFADVNTILKNGGVAIMSTGLGEGENRVSKAIEDALHSPLLNNNDIFNAKKVLLNVSFCEQSELMMEEMNEVHEFMSKFDKGVEVIWGVAVDDALGNKVKITVLATGFGMTSIPGMDEVISKRTQEEEERLAQLEEKEEENRRRIVIAYGEEALKGGAKAHKRRRHVYIFNPEDLDNDEIIASVENSPTYQRDKATLEKIKTKATAVETVASPETEDGSNIISFN